MKYTSIFGKLKCLIELTSSSIIYPIFLIIFVILVALLFAKKVKNKKIIILMIINYLILLIITIISNYKMLSKVFDSIATNIFTNIYFPSTQTYLFTLVLVDIITICSLLNIKCKMSYRITNGICFFTTKFIMILILEVVSKNKIDIFSKKSLFSNTNLVILLELSIGIFIIWLISLAIIYITNRVTERIVNTSSNKSSDTDNIDNIISNTLTVDNINEEENIIPEIEKPLAQVTSNISTIVEKPIEDSFSLNDLTISINDKIDDNIQTVEERIESKENKIDSNILLDKLLNNGLPIIRNNENNQESIKPEHKITKNDYTLNDYKIFNKMLKEVREVNNSNIINIDKKLELRLMLKYSEEEYNLFKGMLKNYSN